MMSKEEKLPFRLSVITDEISQDMETACRLAAKYHLAAVEIRSVEETAPEKLSDSQIQHILAAAHACGLEISALCSSVLKCRQGEETEEKFLDAIRVAKKLGCKLIRAFTYFADPDLDENALVEKLRQYARLAQQEDITVVLENEPSVNASTGAKLGELLNKVGCDNVGALWDPGNNLYGADEPGYPDGYEAVKPWIRHVHLKDAVRIQGETQGTALCRGQADIRGLLEALCRDGYTGYVTVETHYKKNASIDKALLLQPCGSAFSDGGYEATEECLQNLTECLEQLLAQKG